MTKDPGPLEGDAHVSVTRTRTFIAYVAGAFGLGANAMGNFLVPLRANELGAGFELIGLIVGAGALMPALCSVPLGTLIDRIGPRKAFILGTSATAAIGLLFTIPANPFALLVLQPFFGLARTMGWIASQSYVTSLGSVEERAGHTGRFSFFTNVGPMVGPLLVGAAAQMVGFRAAFLVIAAFGAAFAVIGWLLTELTPDGGRARKGVGFRTALSLLALRGMRIALLLTFARLWIEWVWTAFFPVYAVESGIEPAIAGGIVTAKGLVATLMAPTAAFWARRLSPAGTTALGLGLGAAGLFVVPHFVELPWAFTSGMLVGIGTGLSLPLLLTIVTSAAPADQRGVALGLRVSVNQAAATGAPVLVGPLIAVLGPLLAFSFSGATAGVLVLVAAVLSLRNRHD